MGGMFGGGGGGGSNMAAETAARMAQYIAATEADRTKYLSAVGGIADKLENQVKERGSEFLNSLSAEEKTALDRLQKANDWLTSETSAQSNQFKGNIDRVLNDLISASDKLNIGERDALTAQIDGFRQQANALTGDFRAERAGVDTEFTKATQDALATYDTGTRSLGDQFLSAIRGAQDAFSTDMAGATSLDPERLNIFSRAADYLSKAAQQTRMDLLATADPRALELSAIADENAAAMMSGRIGADVQANVARSSAMRALQGGFGASSEMGRGLTARDLGLTSLDLQQRGAQLNDAQRRLNFATRVDGTQVDATGLLANDMNLRARQAETLLNARQQTAESDRNQRVSAMDTLLGGRLSLADTRRQDAVGLANAVFTDRVSRERDLLGLGMNATANYYGQSRNLANTVANNQLSAVGRLFDVGLNNAQSLYGTNVNAASDFYRTGANALGNIFSTRSNAAGQQANLTADAQRTGFTTIANMRTNAAQAVEAAAQQDMLNNQQAQANRNSMWGSLINTGATILGAAVGTAVNPGAGTLMGAQIGGALGSAATGGGGGGGGLSSLGSFGSMLGGRGISSGTTYNSLAGVQSAAPYAASYSNFGGGMGWIPKATAV